MPSSDELLYSESTSDCIPGVGGVADRRGGGLLVVLLWLLLLLVMVVAVLNRSMFIVRFLDIDPRRIIPILGVFILVRLNPPIILFA